MKDIHNDSEPSVMRVDGIGYFHCGITIIKAKGDVKVFEDKRVQTYHR